MIGRCDSDICRNSDLISDSEDCAILILLTGLEIDDKEKVPVLQLSDQILQVPKDQVLIVSM